MEIDRDDPKIKKLAIIGFAIIIIPFFFNDIRIILIREFGKYEFKDGIVVEYHVKTNRPMGVIIQYQFNKEQFKGICTTPLCRDLRVKDSVKLKVFLIDHSIFSVIDKTP